MSRLRFLLDEHVWAGLVELGLELDVDIVQVQEIADAGTPDDKVLALAAKTERVLLTANTRDFAPLAAQWFLDEQEHYGIIIVPGQTEPAC